MTAGERAEMRRAAREGQPISRSAAVAVLRARERELPDIFAASSALRSRAFGSRVHLCSIMNARSGGCPEDCAFCAQSARHGAAVEVYGMRSEAQIAARYEEAAELPIDHFGVVTSGGELDDDGVERICRAIRRIPGKTVGWCASVGAIDEGKIARLREAGLARLHHNLETARSFFPRICGSHGFDERLETVRRIKAAGLEVCCGGVLGLGESDEQRVELAETLREEGVDSIPLNFLVPIPGTPLEGRTPMDPFEILKCIAMFRLVNPRTPIKVCAGRTLLRDLQGMIFSAGANGMMIGRLLTVAGGDVESDLRMLEDLGMEYGTVPEGAGAL